MKLISRGAEAEIYSDGQVIIKKRVEKAYRLKQLDDSIRNSRTKREAKILEKLPPDVPHPKLLSQSQFEIRMENIDGKKVRDILEKNMGICKQIGEKVALMHNSGIIHGDLTTSNMIFHKDTVYLIDFGLSFFSVHVEDKAVDLHLMRQALESKHYTIAEKAFKQMMQGYQSKAHDFEEIEIRYKQVELRGRNKAKF
ncbi:MAG: Kae1-associated serine/threonine protein kinase [Nanoarchaeota archaeon]|nr:Kae1-associated serine/threonine protein kinase [Nanoarchaeota archaeon]